MNKLAPRVLGLLILLHAVTPYAQPPGGCIDYERYSHWAKGINAAFNSLAASGWYLFGAGDQGLTVFDVHDPESPKQVGNVGTGVDDGLVLASGHLAYVGGTVGYNGELKIADVSDPSTPTITGSVSIPDIPANIAITGAYVCVATNELFQTRSSVQVVDVSNPNSPQIIGHLDWNFGAVRGLAAAGSHVFVALNNTLLVVRITNPAQPVVVGGLQLAGNCSAIRIDGSRAFAATDNGLQVINISTPNQPTVLATKPTPCTDVALAGSVACTLGDFAFTVFDVANPTSPTATATMSVPAYGNHQTIAATGSHAYVATNRYSETGIATLHIVALASLSAPPPVGSLSGVGGVVAANGSHAYVLSSTELRIVDVSNPVAPTLAGSVALLNNCQSMSISGSYAYVASGTPYPSTGGHLQVINVSNSAAPAVVGTVDIGAPCGVFSQGSYVFVGDDSGLKIVDVSTPSAPVIIRQVSVGAVHLMTWDGSRVYLYVSNYPPSPTETLSVFNMSDPEHPTLAWQGDEVVFVAGAAVSGSFLYSSVGHPDNPPWLTIGRLPTSNDPTPYVTQIYPKGIGRLVADGNFLYLLDGGTTAHLIDFSVPSKPRFVGDVGPCGSNLVVSGQYIYTAPGDFYVLHAQCGAHATAVTDVTSDALLSVSAFPNPFNPTTRIEYSVPSTGRVTVSVYDVRGQRVASLVNGESKTAGVHAVNWNGQSDHGGVASGIYFMRVEQGGHAATRKMTLLK